MRGVDTRGNRAAGEHIRSLGHAEERPVVDKKKMCMIRLQCLDTESKLLDNVGYILSRWCSPKMAKQQSKSKAAKSGNDNAKHAIRDKAVMCRSLNLNSFVQMFTEAFVQHTIISQ